MNGKESPDQGADSLHEFSSDTKPDADGSVRRRSVALNLVHNPLKVLDHCLAHRSLQLTTPFLAE